MEAHRLKDKIIEQQQQGTCMEEKEENQMRLFQVSLSTRKPKNSPKIKQRKPFETLGKLFEIKEMPWGLQFRPKEGTCVEEKEEDQMSIPQFSISKQSQTLSSAMGVSGNADKSRSCKRKWATVYDFYDHVETTSSAMERAQEVEANLAAEFPSFVKSMLPSNVTGGFWLSLPRSFCDLHLPGHDTTVILVDESGAEYTTKYLMERRGLSGGWRAFSIAHKLVVEDVLVFHLVRTCKFKVYIVRANGLDEVDAALSLLHLDAHAKRMDSEKITRNLKESVGKRLRPFQEEILQENFQNDNQMVLNTSLGLLTDQPENGSEDLGLVLEVRNITS
uniref:TF-B3 domain-containing protein n=1 Tax=Davidia involucrata TaxID=16924 RepID=A0A5B7C068_DAVIN